MTTEMFGAPYGISAAEDQINQNTLTGLKAAQLLGEIGMQPIEMELKKAHAQYYKGMAAEREAKARDLETLQKLEAGVTAAKSAADQGKTLTVEDMPKTTSMADPLEQLVQAGQQQGVSARLLAPLAEKASLIKQHEATAASADARQQLNQIRTGRERAQQVAAFASAALQTPEAYDTLRMQAANQGFKVDTLPQKWDARVLTALRDSGITADKQLQLREKEIQDTAQRKRWDSSNARDGATIVKAKAQTELVRERTNVLRKHGGEDSPEVKAGKEELRLSREALRKARDRKEFPPAPLDPAQREPNKTYTAANGARFMWTKDPTSGKMVGMVLSPPPGTKAAAAVSAAAPKGAAEVESDDAEDGDE